MRADEIVTDSATVAMPARGVLDAIVYPTPVALMVEIIFAILVISTVIIFLLPRLLPKSQVPVVELRSRLRSWWVMVALSVIAVTINQNLSLVFLAGLSYISLKEFYTLVHLRLADRRAILLAYLAIPVQYWWVHGKWYIMFLIFVPVYLFLIIALRLVLAGETQRFMTSVGKLHWGLMAFVFGLSHLAYLLMADISVPFEAGNTGLLIYLLFLAEFNDVLQYVFGKTLGRHKMSPNISPNKTWEGFLGGLICTAGLAVALRFLTPMTWQYALGAGVLIGITGPIGGMVISAIKRDVGVKDSGSLIPGHGGVLDRVDSLCFSAPLFFHYIAYLYW
jgi:phosphatidate cytidylyltransferase